MFPVPGEKEKEIDRLPKEDSTATCVDARELGK